MPFLAGFPGCFLDCFLGCEVVAAGGFPFPFGRALVGGDVAEALSDRALLDFCGVLVHDGGLVVAQPVAPVRVDVTLVSVLGTLGGAGGVVPGDGFARGEILLPALQFRGALGGFVTW